jgi:hypothetical protein
VTVQQLALPVALSLPGGLSVLVDEQDAEWLSRYRWRAIRIRHTWYAVRADSDGLVYMHREILDAPAGLIVDHRDGNGLNNTRANLRLVTARENAINAAKRAGCSSRHRGVDWCKSMRAWRVRVWPDGREQLVGYYTTEEEAAEARRRAAVTVYGEFARRWG